MGKRLIICGAIVLGLAVILGAFGAHALRARLSPEALGQWKTGVEYQFYHGLGMLLIALLGERLDDSAARRIGWCFLLGIICFSGSLYLLSTRELSGLSGIGAIVGPITPLGGLLFIAGWVLLLLAAARSMQRG